MAYRIEKSETKKPELIIDGWEKGIAPSPYLGIANIRNLNTTYYPGTAYVNYRRRAATTSGVWYAGANSTNTSNNSGWIFAASGSAVTTSNPVHKAISSDGIIYILYDDGKIYKQNSVNSSTFTELENGTGRIGDGAKGLAYWNDYLVVFGDGVIEFCGDGSGDAGVIPGNWNLYDYAASTGVATVTSPPTTTINLAGFTNLVVGSMITFTSTGTLPSPLVAGTVYVIASSLGSDNYTIAIIGSGQVTFTTVGTGVHTASFNPISMPMGNVSNLTFTSALAADDVSATISTYTTPAGTLASTSWVLPTGQYNAVDSNGNNLLATFTNNSSTVSFLSPIVQPASGTYSVNILDTTAPTNKTWVSKVDGNLYFANGRSLGRILSQNTNISFNPSNPDSYIVTYAVTELLQSTDTVTDMTDLKSTMVLCGNYDTYTWNYVSANVSAPSPVGEQIIRIINILSNLYILAGTKGSIYTSNGYSNQILFKIPDFIAGVIDPVWHFGDIMVHRAKLWFQAYVKNTAGINLLAGIFSLNVSPTVTGNVSLGNTLIMESQNSYGLTPASGALTSGILVDYEPFSSTGVDSYYSAWSNGATTGGIDYNDTTLWQDWEPTIETDIIPVGTFFNKKAMGNIEFKLDRPMISGDSLRIYWRSSLTGTYTLLGTTTTAVLSSFYPSNISEAQWLQFKIQMDCASSGSSFIPLREMRVQYN